MKYTAHVNMVTKPYIGLPTTRTPYTLDDSTTGWATNRTDDTDTGVCYDTSTHNWQIC